MRSTEVTGDESTREQPAPTHLMLAFGIGTLVGIGVAMTWLPERRRRRGLPRYLARRYHRARGASGAALSDLRGAGREMISDFTHELAANVEAAREQLTETTRDHLKGLRKLRRERRKLLR
ncbi:MAG: hypothetical protein GWN99_06245 [Gemmatimonadetes bacterium]|uniref:Uncharacterized protein n=1 Tax=Candidatus Kutchimonas denitrificans TaxID=3056748 RepID=A0AAE4Z9C8_9BACT|nr:hypothetical protein [Gemmatimonadota bacterium]NIR76224.1 hypothetical protein [Candidatus Kutchimonas denitrificans]NIS00664.1 hypothetical protein [Gemmatimonadota bacterium]NIT66809.1 hypothetical protein [Gemmatimonadota bacterium]NIV23408.1 hypothetical protein [Gemmatimonadota bacterium]